MKTKLKVRKKDYVCFYFCFYFLEQSKILFKFKSIYIWNCSNLEIKIG